MKLICIVALAALAFAHPISQSMTDKINAGATWTAMTPEENPFSYMTEEEIVAIMGTRLTVEEEIPSKLDYNADDLPTNFNAQVEEADCFQEIRDQAACGSCWAFGATEALAQRFCKQTGEKVVLSPEDMVECDKFNLGCQGGILGFAWGYLEKHGVVTEECYHYHSEKGETEACHTTCENEADFATDKHFSVSKSKVHPKTYDDIRAEIFYNGAVEAGFTVFEDFMAYKTGIYEHTTGKQLGGHAVMLTGFGEDDSGRNYFIASNSWGAKWGEEGQFRIYADQCGIDGQIYAGEPQQHE